MSKARNKSKPRFRLLPPIDPAETRARRDLIRFMVASAGTLHLTKPLARGLGLSRRDLRAEITGWLNEPGPHRGQILWAGRNRLAGTTAATGPLIVDLDGTQLAHLFVALARAQETSISTTEAASLADLRNRLAAMLPVTLRQLVNLATRPDAPGLGGDAPPALAPVAEAIRHWRRLRLDYQALDGAVTARTVWPLILHYRDACLIGWCELRKDFRAFRLDHIQKATPLDDAPPRPRAALLAEWEPQRWRD